MIFTGKFRDKFFFLSNMYPHQICDFKDGVEYQFQSSEVHYQCFTMIDSPVLFETCRTLSPKASKQFAKKHKADMTLEQKADVMRRSLSLKFRNPKLAMMLIQTHDSDLVEENNWHDNTWGNCVCEKCKDIAGKNTLGNLLKELKYKIIDWSWS